MCVRILATGDDCNSWVSVCWMGETKRKEALPSGKSMPVSTAESVFCSACARFRVIFLPIQYTPWSIYMFGNINKENETKQKDAHITHNTKWDCAPLFCIFCNPDCGNYLAGFTSLFFHSKGSFWNRVTLNSV